MGHPGSCADDFPQELDGYCGSSVDTMNTSQFFGWSRAFHVRLPQSATLAGALPAFFLTQEQLMVLEAFGTWKARQRPARALVFPGCSKFPHGSSYHLVGLFQARLDD
jgi:hypothetical protein